MEGRFNNVEGDESNIRGFDFSSSEDSDAFYGYIGEESEGAFGAGTGVIDYENPDPDGWLSGFEILTADARATVVGDLSSENFLGIEAGAQVLEADLNLSGHNVNLGFLTADVNGGGSSDGFGFGASANAYSATYTNGAPSTDNSNDLGFTGGLSFGVGGGLNVAYSDPDEDGITNLGFDVSAGPVDAGFRSEYLGSKVDAVDEAVDEEIRNAGGSAGLISWFTTGMPFPSWGD